MEFASTWQEKKNDVPDQDFKSWANLISSVRCFVNSLIKLFVNCFYLKYLLKLTGFLLSLWQRITCQLRTNQLIICGGHNAKSIKKGESMLDICWTRQRFKTGPFASLVNYSTN